MEWNVKNSLVWGETVPLYVVTVCFDESEEKLKRTVANYCVSMGYMHGWSPALNHFNTQPLPLNSKHALEEYLRGVRDGASEYRDRLNYLKRFINSFYGLPSEMDTEQNISPTFEIKECISEDIKNLGFKTASLDDRIRVLERHDVYAANNVSDLKHRTSLLEQDIAKDNEVVNETVDKVSALQHKVDELEAYIKFLNPHYPLIIDDIVGNEFKKKKGWFKK